MTEQESDPRRETEPSLFTQALSLVDPAPENKPATLQLKPGQSVVAIGDSITAYGNFNGYLTVSVSSARVAAHAVLPSRRRNALLDKPGAAVAVCARKRGKRLWGFRYSPGGR